MFIFMDNNGNPMEVKRYTTSVGNYLYFKNQLEKK